MTLHTRHRSEYVWNTMEELGRTTPDLRGKEKTDEFKGRLETLEAVGLAEQDEDGWHLTSLGHTFIGGLHGGRNRHDNPFEKEPDRSVWSLAAGLVRR